MALIKSMPVTNVGGTVEYWRLTAVDISHTSGRVGAWLMPYVTNADREAGRTPVNTMARWFSFALADFPGATDLHSVTTAQIYAAIKATLNPTDPLAGAADA